MASTLKIQPSWQGSLSHKAFGNEMSIGRKYPEKSQIGFGDPFALDVIRIATSNVSRRLGEVAQVVPLSDYSMSNRQNHTLCVASYSGYVS